MSECKDCEQYGKGISELTEENASLRSRLEVAVEAPVTDVDGELCRKIHELEAKLALAVEALERIAGDEIEGTMRLLAQETLAKLKEKPAQQPGEKVCPECGGAGYTAERAKGSDTPEQTQCQNCLGTGKSGGAKP